MKNVVDMGQLRRCLNIPAGVCKKIRESCDDEKHERDELLYYWRNFSCFSLWSWTFLGGWLHYYGEETALTAAKTYIQRAPGTCGCGMCMYLNVEDAYDHVYMTQQIHACSDVHCVCSSAFVDYTDDHTDHICAYFHPLTHPELSLTLDNLTSVFDGVVNMDGVFGGVVPFLHIPFSKRDELKQQYDGSERKRAYTAYYITQHPAPSWRIVALALWRKGELGALEVVQKLYHKGEPCADSCRSEGRRGNQVAIM